MVDEYTKGDAEGLVFVQVDRNPTYMFNRPLRLLQTNGDQVDDASLSSVSD